MVAVSGTGAAAMAATFMAGAGIEGAAAGVGVSASSALSGFSIAGPQFLQDLEVSDEEVIVVL